MKKLEKIRKIYYTYKNFSVKTVYKLFNTIIEPGLLYEAEIWGIENAAMKADAIIAKLEKEMLAVKRSASSNGALGEVVWRKTSIKAKQKAIKYLIRTEANAKALKNNTGCIKHNWKKLSTKKHKDIYKRH